MLLDQFSTNIWSGRGRIFSLDIVFVKSAEGAALVSLQKLLLASGLCTAILYPVAALAMEESSVGEARMILSRRLNDVVFLDAKVGFVVGGEGILLSTLNGGKNWTRRQIAKKNLTRITFQHRSRGWIVSEDGEVFSSRNSGRTWLRRAIEGTEVAAIRFVSPEVGWMVGNRGHIMSSLNGGKTWQRQFSDSKYDLLDIDCFSTRICIAVGAKRTILSTYDGGSTWNEQYPPIGELDLVRVKISRDGVAWVLATGYKYGALLLSRTQGKEWSLVSQNLPIYPTSLFFFNAGKGLTAESTVLFTNDGLATWNTVWSGGPLIKEMFFLNEDLGWAVGDYKTIIHSQDGGISWTVQLQEITGWPTR